MVMIIAITYQNTKIAYPFVMFWPKSKCHYKLLHLILASTFGSGANLTSTNIIIKVDTIKPETLAKKNFDESSL